MAKTPARERLRLSWYGGSERGGGGERHGVHWYRAKQGLVEVRWVFVHDVEGTHRDEYFFSTELSSSAQEVVQTCAAEVEPGNHLEEMRSYIGLETTRGRKKETVLCAWSRARSGCTAWWPAFTANCPRRGTWCGGRSAGEEGFDLLRRHHRGKTLAVGGVGISPGRRSGVVRETAAGVAGGDLEWSGPCGPAPAVAGARTSHPGILRSERPKTPDSTVCPARPAPDGLFMPPSLTSSFGIKWAKSSSEAVNQSRQGDARSVIPPPVLGSTGGLPQQAESSAARLTCFSHPLSLSSGQRASRGISSRRRLGRRRWRSRARQPVSGRWRGPA